jgi:CHAD domain-containing protein
MPKLQAVNRMRPVAALKTQIVALDAAMLVAVSAAEKSAVHKLRTSTRRVEAQMTLLAVLSRGEKPLQLPPYSNEVDAVRKRLRRVRQAAGAVRDLDVQSDAIHADTPDGADLHEGTPGDAMRKQAKQLRKHLEAQREHEAEHLVAILTEEEQKLAASLRTLEKALKPANARIVAQSKLIQDIERWFARQTHRVLQVRAKADETPQDALRRHVEALDEDALHTIRKAAKLCRYMAESTPETSAAHTMADRFEAMQEAGGKWHDWLLLQRLSARFHGKRAELTERYGKHSEAALADYHLKLAELLPAVTP